MHYIRNRYEFKKITIIQKILVFAGSCIEDEELSDKKKNFNNTNSTYMIEETKETTPLNRRVKSLQVNDEFELTGL